MSLKYAPRSEPVGIQAHVAVAPADNPDMPMTDRAPGTPGGARDPRLNYSPS